MEKPKGGWRSLIRDLMTFYCVTCKRKHSEKVEDVKTKKLGKRRGSRVFAIATCSKHGNKLWRVLGVP